MHVNQGVFEIFMTEQDLKGPEINAGLIDMCGKTMPKRMGMDVFLYARAMGGFPAGVPNGFCINGAILAAIVAGKQPGTGFAVVVTPVGSKCGE